MEFRNCFRCGKAFMYSGGKPICQDCRKDAEDAYEKIRIFLRDNPHIKPTISDIAEECDVEEEIVMQLMEEGRLEMVGRIESSLKCRRCGVKIESGSYCPGCAAELTRGLQPESEKKGESRDGGEKKEEKGKAKEKMAMYMSEVLSKKRK